MFVSPFRRRVSVLFRPILVAGLLIPLAISGSVAAGWALSGLALIGAGVVAVVSRRRLRLTQ